MHLKTVLSFFLFFLSPTSSRLLLLAYRFNVSAINTLVFVTLYIRLFPLSFILPYFLLFLQYSRRLSSSSFILPYFLLFFNSLIFLTLIHMFIIIIFPPFLIFSFFLQYSQRLLSSSFIIPYFLLFFNSLIS